ncbi:MAG TPA: uroporphyrinogen decarboxylase family protein [Anaerolineales bacterium]
MLILCGMTGKELLMASLRGQETDHVSWAPLIDPYYTAWLAAKGYGGADAPRAAPETQLGLWSEQIDALDIPYAIRLVGGDILERHSPTVRVVEDSCITRRTLTRGMEDLEIIETPVGTLETEHCYSIEGQTRYISKHPISSIEDLKVLQFVWEHTHFEEDFAVFRHRIKVIGNDGIPTSDGPQSPIQHFYMFLCGIQVTTFLLLDHPAEMDECFAVMNQKNHEEYRLVCESPTDVVIDYENTSSTVMSPAFYRQYSEPYINEYADICHAAGKLFITHMCGKLSAFNPELRHGRQDGFDSICPPTTGDIWACDARRAWGDDRIIIGGVEPAALARMDANQTRAYVTRILDEMPTLRHFVLCTGDATAYGTPVENLRAVQDIVEHYPWE